jgi:hypothetical protein
MRFFSNFHLSTRSAAAASFLLISLAANAGIFDDDEARKAILDLSLIHI